MPTGGLAGLADHSSRPASCPHQIEPALEAAIVVMRKENPDWGSRTILTQLRLGGVDPLPGRSSIHRALSDMGGHPRSNRTGRAHPAAGSTRHALSGRLA